MFTIIIPTFDRHDLLLRSIDYYQYFDCNVLITDSSNSRLNHKFPPNITYKHFPKMGFAKKIFKVTKYIKTKNVCLAPDDDYILESSLKTGACFLDNNPDYASVQGRYYKFELIENQVIFSPRYALSSCHYSIESDDKFARLASTFNPYHPHIYSIHRTDLFIKSWKFVSASQQLDNWGSLSLTEFITPLVPMCYGKHKILPILWMVRDFYIFDPIRRQQALTNNHKIDYSVAYNFSRFNSHIKDVETFLNSEDCKLLKKCFRDAISELANNEESVMLFNMAFKSFVRWLIIQRNKITAKIVIKLFIPKWALKHYKRNQENQYASGVEEVFLKNAFNKIRLSVLNFKKCYDNYR